VGHRFPVFNKRTRHEGLSVFAWTASKLAKSGLSPARTWSLAAESVPNNAMRDEMVAMGLRLNGSEKLSDIVRGSPIFTEEYMPLIATAEVTGDIPGTLDRLSQASRTEFETAETYAKMRSGCWGALGCLVTAFFGIAVICWVYYRVIPSRIESDTDDPQVQQSQQAP
jgi:type II secretory pathway component PulF